LRRWIERIPWRSLFWLALAAITVLALIPWGEEIPRPFRWSDKLNHFAAFVVLANLMLEAYRPGAWRTVAFLTLYGALIEGIQSFLPWRSAEWGDLGVDLLAASVGVLLWTLLRGRGLDAARH
jgi:VanZ family protein